MNAISHGNGYDLHKSVYFTARVNTNELVIAIEDQGNGFDPKEVPDPTLEDNLLQASGRGLLLMKSFVDSLKVDRTEKGGTEVVMVKHFSDERHRGQQEELNPSPTLRKIKNVVVIDLCGSITLDGGSEILQKAVHDLLDSGQKDILLNFREVSYMDSSGLGALVSTHTTGVNQGAKIKLVNVQKKVGDLLQITKLFTVLEIHENESIAVESYSP